MALYSQLPSTWFLSVGIALSFLSVFLPPSRAIRALRLIGVFSLGTLISVLQLKAVISKQLPMSLDREEITAGFEVISLVERGDKSLSFNAKLSDVTCAVALDCTGLENTVVRLSWFFPKKQVRGGDVWRARLKLRRPRGLVNPGGFDYHSWLLAQGVSATGYVAGSARRVTDVRNWAYWREGVRDRLLAVGQNTDFVRFWLALTLADRSRIDQEDWRLLQNTGTVHLVAISGLHIGLVALLLHFIGRAVAKTVVLLRGTRGDGVRLILWLPAVLSCCGAVIYAGLAGFSIPTVRALVTCTILHCLRLMGWRISAMTTLGIVVAAVALHDPLAAMAPGFWLSFLAVACLIYLALQIQRPSTWGGKVTLYVRMQVALSIALVVPLITLGQVASLTAPLANLLAVPVISLLIVPGLLGGLMISVVSSSAAQMLLRVLDHIFSAVWWWLEHLGNVSWSTWWSSSPLNVLNVAAAVVAVVLVLSPAALKLRTLGLVVLTGALFIPQRPQFDVRLTILDVGQGLSVILQSDGDTLVYDTGPRFSASFDAGSRIVLPYIRQQGIKDADMVVSHDDLDHSGGAETLFANLNIRHRKSGEPLNTTETDACQSGQSWSVGRVNVAVLWPDEPNILSGNAASCTTLLSFVDAAGEEVTILLPGDIDKAVENRIVERIPSSLDIVMAPHHGSASSSSYGFVRHTSPTYVVYSAGYQNRYRHPNASVRRRYQREKSVELNTAETGAIVFTWRGAELVVSKTRQSRSKPWYW